MSQQQTANTCADCFHPEHNHSSGGVCSGSITCMCSKYNPPFLFEFAQRIEKEKHDRKGLFKRIKWLLEEIPSLRNSGEKSFYRVFIEVWYGVKIRKYSGLTLTRDVWDRIPSQDSVSRERRRVTDNKHFPELGSYNKEVLWHKTAIFQALLEMSTEAD